MHVRLTNIDIVNAPNVNINFHQTLKRYLESSIITKIYQYNNDRVMIFDINHFDDLGYVEPLNLILEFFGRNANIILVNKDGIIIDALKRETESSDPTLRIILPKARYEYPSSSRVNPYLEKVLKEENCYEGVSSLLFSELSKKGTFDLLYQECAPVLIKTEKKNAA